MGSLTKFFVKGFGDNMAELSHDKKMQVVMGRIKGYMQHLDDPYQPPECKVEYAIKLSADAALMAAFLSGWQYDRRSEMEKNEAALKALKDAPYGTPYKVGDRVVAVQLVTEDGGPEIPTAEPCKDGWVHARAGEEGEIIFTGDDISIPTVRFDRTGTATCVILTEIALVRPLVQDPTKDHA